MLLARSSGEEDERTVTAAPAACQTEQASSHKGAGKVLLRHGDLPALPALAELVQVREQDALQNRVKRETREQVVERRLGRELVEGVQGASELLASGVQIGGGRVFATSLFPEHEACRLCGGDALAELRLHPAHPRFVVVAVEPEAAVRALGTKEPVTPLPRPEQLDADADATAQLPDPDAHDS